MKKQAFVPLAAAVLILTAANQVPAEVSLQSAEYSTGRGFLNIPRADPGSGTSQPTTFGPWTSFPNDQSNFAGIGPNGLNVLVNQTATFSHHSGNTYIDDWTAERFRISFTLDEPAQYTYQRSLSGGDDSIGEVRLGNLVMPLFGQTSGISPAGQYTLSGTIDFQSYSPTEGPDVFRSASFRDIRFTVAPEPATLAVAAVMLLCFSSRGHRRVAPASNHPNQKACRA